MWIRHSPYRQNSMVTRFVPGTVGYSGIGAGKDIHLSGWYARGVVIYAKGLAVVFVAIGMAGMLSAIADVIHAILDRIDTGLGTFRLTWRFLLSTRSSIRPLSCKDPSGSSARPDSF
jgi:hypothetical protein